ATGRSSAAEDKSPEIKPESVSRAALLCSLCLASAFSPARPRCRAVRDSTLAACYRSLYAPRTGGAYDSHHRTAGIAGRTRRRGGRVAARGARAAAQEDATDWRGDRAAESDPVAQAEVAALFDNLRQLGWTVGVGGNIQARPSSGR